MEAHLLDRNRQTQFKNLHLLDYRNERYDSRYFDYQRAFRYLLSLRDGNTVECSAYQHFSGIEPTTLAVDISSMVGCPVGCQFCASAAIRYKRPLTVAEMSEQAEKLFLLYDTIHFPKLVCSFQGIGEPSLLPLEILKASRMILAIDSRIHISIATSLANTAAISIWGKSDIAFDNIQLSCSATTDEKARKLVPHGPLPSAVFAAVAECASFPNIRKTKLNYILIAGVNDSDEDLRRLIESTVNAKLIVKISTLNPTAAAEHFSLKAASVSRAKYFRDALLAAGVASFIYGAFHGTTISCGQLISLAESRRGGINDNS